MVRLGHYFVVERIGSGGMGEVYLARDQHLERDVAIKVLPSKMFSDDSARKHFRREALALSKLNHPNIATIHDFDTQQGIDFLVMEYVPGVTVAERVAGHGLREKELTRLGLQLVEGLTAAHERHIIHRDLKPHNLRLTPDGRLKILDFGLAKLAKPATPEAETENKTLTVMGTLPYMSPEQLQGRTADARSDIWAVGTVLYEMATGHVPFHENTATATALAILHRPVIPPGRLAHELSPRGEDIILKCLEKDAENRYQSAKELAVDLRRLSAATSGTLIQVAEPESARSFRRAALEALTMLLVLAALLVTFNFGGWRDRLLGYDGQPQIGSLAVLPLSNLNLSRDPEQDYFADGMTEALITDLAKSPNLRVISRSSVMHYKGTAKPLREIGRELHVDAVVEGSVLRAENRVRITAQLIRADTDQNLWANSYERDVRDILALQSEVAHAITQQVEGRLSQRNETRAESGRSVNPEVYEAYLKGRYYWNKRDRASLEKSLDYFNEAIAKDPNYALAYAGLADVYVVIGSDWATAPKDINEQAKAAAQKALAIDNSLVEPHTSLASVYHNQWNWQGAEREFKRAIELNPNYATAHHWYSIYLATAGRFDEAVSEAKKAAELDPLSLIIRASLGDRLNEAGRYDDGASQCRKALDMDPNFGLGHLCIGISYVNEGHFEKGIPELQRGMELLPGSPYFMGQLGIAYALSGNRARAREVLDKLKKTSQTHLPNYSIAVVYAGLSDKEQALVWLKKGYEERDENMIFMKIEPVLGPIRPDPRFQDLMHRVGFSP